MAILGIYSIEMAPVDSLLASKRAQQSVLLGEIADVEQKDRNGNTNRMCLELHKNLPFWDILITSWHLSGTLHVSLCYFVANVHSGRLLLISSD